MHVRFTHETKHLFVLLEHNKFIFMIQVKLIFIRKGIQRDQVSLILRLRSKDFTWFTYHMRINNYSLSFDFYNPPPCTNSAECEKVNLQWLSFLVCALLKTKAILLEQQWYYLTHSWIRRMMGVGSYLSPRVLVWKWV